MLKLGLPLLFYANGFVKRISGEKEERK